MNKDGDAQLGIVAVKLIYEVMSKNKLSFSRMHLYIREKNELSEFLFRQDEFCRQAV